MLKMDRSTKPRVIKFPLNIEPTKALNLVMQLMDDMTKKIFYKKRSNVCWRPLHGRHGNL